MVLIITKWTANVIKIIQVKLNIESSAILPFQRGGRGIKGFHAHGVTPLIISEVLYDMAFGGTLHNFLHVDQCFSTSSTLRHI